MLDDNQLAIVSYVGMKSCYLIEVREEDVVKFSNGRSPMELEKIPDCSSFYPDLVAFKRLQL